MPERSWGIACLLDFPCQNHLNGSWEFLKNQKTHEKQLENRHGKCLVSENPMKTVQNHRHGFSFVSPKSHENPKNRQRKRVLAVPPQGSTRGSTRELLFLSMILYGYFFSPMTTHSSFSRWYGVPQFGHCRRCMASKLAAQVLQFTAWMEKP